MSLKHTILGFLNAAPKTGYDLQKSIDLSIQHFWPSTQSQIYRTLKELEGEKLISGEIHIQSEKPNKKVYTLTAAGQEELVRWLSEPLVIPPHRSQFLVQLFFSRHLDPSIIISNLENHRNQLEKRLAFLESDEAQSRIELGRSAQEKAIYQIIIENGIHILKSEIEWANHSIGRLYKFIQKN
ncbi:MAG: PadR family transcriptional regulator [Anaerolineales bacterium]|nr:PadR family transcriptional regulator [Anaerolineales bacterium]